MKQDKLYLQEEIKYKSLNYSRLPFPNSNETASTQIHFCLIFDNLFAAYATWDTVARLLWKVMKWLLELVM